MGSSQVGRHRPPVLHDLVSRNTSRASCLFNVYQPCSCEIYALEVAVTCDSVPVEMIQAAFEKSIIVNHFALSLTGNYTSLPANLTADKTILSFLVDCSGGPLTMDADVLRSSQHQLIYIGISNCDLQFPGWQFLTDFDALQFLIIEGGSLATFSSMPFLAKLQTLYLWYGNEFSQWYDASQTPSMNYISVSAVESIKPDAINILMDSIAQFNATLQSLDLNGLALTQVPPQIKSLIRLTDLSLDDNRISTLTSASFNFSAKVNFLSLFGLTLQSIEPGAFQGSNF